MFDGRSSFREARVTIKQQASTVALIYGEDYRITTQKTERNKSLYCGGASRYWPRSLVLSIAGREIRKKEPVRTVGTERAEGRGWMILAETRTVVMQELFDEVYMGEDHTPTAVSFKLQFIKGITREPRG
jgi:hypothetical protein